METMTYCGKILRPSWKSMTITSRSEASDSTSHSLKNRSTLRTTRSSSTTVGLTTNAVLATQFYLERLRISALSSYQRTTPPRSEKKALTYTRNSFPQMVSTSKFTRLGPSTLTQKLASVHHLTVSSKGTQRPTKKSDTPSIWARWRKNLPGGSVPDLSKVFVASTCSDLMERPTYAM